MADLVIQAATLGLVERVAHVEQEQALVKHLTTQQLVAESIKREDEKIIKTPEAQSKQVRERNRGRDHQFNSRNDHSGKGRGETGTDCVMDDVDLYSEAPPEGLLINLKV